MPADMPAAVQIWPSLTTRSWHTLTSPSSVNAITPTSALWHADREQAGAMQNKRSRANRENRLTSLRLAGHKPDQGFVVYLFPGSFAARHQQIVKLRAFVERDLRV